MKYLVCEKQEGEGCDYTIGCGMRFDFIEADSIQDAIEQTVFPDGKDESSQLEGENALEKILIIPAEYVTVVDVASMASEIKQQRKREAAEAQKAKEIAELKRLQSKYGGQQSAHPTSEDDEQFDEDWHNDQERIGDGISRFTRG